MAQNAMGMGGQFPSSGIITVDDPGAFTGFGTFDVDPVSGGVVDSRGAFNPAFNNRTSRPMFEAETDPLRSVLPGLANKVKAGDANAAMNYDAIYRTYQDRKGIYDLAAATGLNDRNSSFIMRHAFDAVTSQSFGGGADAFRRRYATYLANLSVDRDTNAERLIEGDQRLDNVFRSSFLAALETAGDVFRPSSSVRNQYAGNDAAVAVESLRVKEALSAWEKANGFRTDDEREAIMSAAAAYYAKCKANPGLRSLVSNPGAIVAAAASRVGSQGAGGADPFRDYDDALAMLDRRITYTGGSAMDAARGFGGDSQTLAFSAIKDAYQQAYGRNLSAGVSAETGLRDSRELHDALVANLKRVNPRVAASGAGAAVISDLATNIMEQMSDTGTVDLSKASMMYYDVPAGMAPQYSGPVRAIGDGLTKALSEMADQLVTDVLQNRSSLRYPVNFANAFAPDFLSPGPSPTPNPEYTREGLASTVSSAFDRLLASNAEAYRLAQSDPKFFDGFRQALTEYFFNANNVADPSFISGNIGDAPGVRGGSPGYRVGAQDLIQALVLGKELEALGFDLRGWTPGVTGDDARVRGRGSENFRNLYGGLVDVLRDQVSIDPKDDAEFYRAQAGQQAIDDIRTLIDQAGPPQGLVAGERDRVAASLREKYAKTAEGIVGDVFGKADTAARLRFAEGAKDRMTPRVGVSSEQLQALRELSSDMFSDQLNPALVRNLRAYAAGELGTMTGLSKDMQAYYVDAYLPGLVAMTQLAFRDNPEIPVWYASDRLALKRMLDERSKALFVDAQRQSDIILQQQNAAYMRLYNQKLDANEQHQ